MKTVLKASKKILFYLLTFLTKKNVSPRTKKYWSQSLPTQGELQWILSENHEFYWHRCVASQTFSAYEFPNNELLPADMMFVGQNTNRTASPFYRGYFTYLPTNCNRWKVFNFAICNQINLFDPKLDQGFNQALAQFLNVIEIFTETKPSL